MKKLLIVVSILGLLGTACGTIAPQAKPETHPIGTVFTGGLDEESLGKSNGYPLASHHTALQREEHLVSNYSGGREKLYPHHIVKKGPAPTPLAKAEAMNISSVNA
jgi:hypothetical protein